MGREISGAPEIEEPPEEVGRMKIAAASQAWEVGRMKIAAASQAWEVGGRMKFAAASQAWEVGRMKVAAASQAPVRKLLLELPCSFGFLDALDGS